MLPDGRKSGGYLQEVFFLKIVKWEDLIDLDQARAASAGSYFSGQVASFEADEA